jgi:hypothetical protein
MIENIPANNKQYPEQESDIRLTLKIKQHAGGVVTGSVFNFEVNNFEGLIPNVTELLQDYGFHYATDKMIGVTIDHVLKARA